MTIGERIQMHRKNQGLSQEELAQKIFVSRQTVSQWETDQTVPTVDNIYRLKEILGVSFDELLSDEKIEKEEKEEEEKPLEEYETTTSWEELKFALDKAQQIDIKKIILIVALIIGLVVFSIYVEDFGVSLGFLLALLFVTVVYFCYIFKMRSKVKKSLAANGSDKKYVYRLYADRLEILLYEKDLMIGMDLFRRDDIKAFHENEKYYAFQAKNQLYTISKSLVSRESYFYNFIYKSAYNEVKLKPVHKIISAILIVLSILSPLFGGVLTAYRNDYFDEITSANMWMLFLFLPLPILSIVYGIYLKKKKFRNKGNIVTGIIFVFILCLAGSSSFNMGDYYYYSDMSRLTKWEEKIQVDFPDNGEIVTSVNDPEMEEIEGYYVQNAVRFDEAGKNAFMREIASDERWVSEFPDSLSPCFDGGYYESVLDYNLLYNVTTGEVNTPPKKSGEYRFVLFKYLREDGVLEFEEYIIEIDMGD